MSSSRDKTLVGFVLRGQETRGNNPHDVARRLLNELLTFDPKVFSDHYSQPYNMRGLIVRSTGLPLPLPSHFLQLDDPNFLYKKNIKLYDPVLSADLRERLAMFATAAGQWRIDTELKFVFEQMRT